MNDFLGGADGFRRHVLQLENFLVHGCTSSSMCRRMFNISERVPYNFFPVCFSQVLDSNVYQESVEILSNRRIKL